MEQLRNRRDKLCERLNHGPEKILKGYLKKEKGKWIEKYKLVSMILAVMKSWKLF